MDESDKKTDEKTAKQEAGQNTAHVAGRAASRYFGGEVGGKIYDAASKTKLGQAVEKKVGNKIAKTPGLGNANKKLNDTGAVDAANKGINAMGGGKGGAGMGQGAKMGGSGGSLANSTSKLGKSTGHMKKNKSDSSDVPEALKNKNKNKIGIKNKKLTGDSESNEEESKQDESTESSASTESDTADKVKSIWAKLPLAVKLKIILIGALVFIVLSVLISVSVTSTVGSNAYVSSIRLSGKDYDGDYDEEDDEIAYMYSEEEDPELYQLEKNYYDEILGNDDGKKGIINLFKERFNVDLEYTALLTVIDYRYFAYDESLEGKEAFTEPLNNSLSDEYNNRFDELGIDDKSDFITDFSNPCIKLYYVALLMMEKTEDGYRINLNKNGGFYNTLYNSQFFLKYYDTFLGNNPTEKEKTDLIDDIFDELKNAYDVVNDIVDSDTVGGVVSNTSIVHVQTCEFTYKYKEINGLNVYDNPSAAKDTEYPDYLNLREYIKGVIDREIGISSGYKEAMKAQAIAALSFLINDRYSGFDLKSGEMYFPAGDCRQASCSPEYGCTAIQTGRYSSFYIGENRFSGENSYPPITESQNEILEEVLNDVFGKVMVKKGVTAESFSGSQDVILTSYCHTYNLCTFCYDGKCMLQMPAIEDAKSGMTYEEILKKYYSLYDYDIIDITEGLYFQSGETYNGTINLNEGFHYHQGDSPWASKKLCGGSKVGSISSSGCNITSAAIAISLLTNSKVTPETLNERQNDIKTCNENERYNMIMDFARLYGLNPVEIKKNNGADVEDMLSKIASGNYVAIARIGENNARYFTERGHYVVLVGAKNENNNDKVLVWDPGSRTSSRDNYWADLNSDLMPYLQSEYSFILIGRN